MIRASRFGSLVVALCALATIAAAERSEKPGPWGKVKTPSSGEPEAIGDYSAGCVQGAKPLPLAGEGYQVMHPSRLRYFGHPDLLDFISKLGQGARAAQLADLLVGDLSQPRGGRATGGHASHQSGLDVDLWFFNPSDAGAAPLDDQQREQLKARSVIDGKHGTVLPRFAARVSKLLQLTAADPRVERVFVHPIIKRELCALPGSERAWLGKLRPWFGHDDHFHVRLACPKDSPLCRPQTEVGKGDGCGDELAWWFSPEATQDRDQGRKRYQSKVASKPAVPARCRELIAQP
jgi:penicillin-insensitive murein endopeptidase